ncbi:olfactory receptor 6E1-like [Gasterosteus aculeatus]
MAALLDPESPSLEACSSRRTPGPSWTEPTLHIIIMFSINYEPMYLFLCSLFVNELFGSTGLFPFLLVQILSDTHTVSFSSCYLQIFCLYTYANVQFYNLAVMSYDRYLAICYPLQYNTYMAFNKVIVLLVLTWLFPLLNIVIMISLSASLRLCGNIIDRLFCDNYSVVKLACSDTTIIYIYGLMYTFIVLFSLAIPIFYTYMRILRVCISGSKQTKQKAVSTCTPHLASLLNFSYGCFFEIAQGRFDITSHVIYLTLLSKATYNKCIQP